MQTSKIKDVAAYLESLAPLAYQESYDNSGLIVGDPSTAVSNILVTLDCTEEVIKEAVATKCNLVVAHHPVVFKGIKKLTGQTYVERTVVEAIRNNISIYAIHTNLDNIHHGVNQKIGERLGLVNTQILLPRTDSLSKLVTFIPKEQTQPVLDALHAAGAGQIGKYSDCSFQVEGTGTFRPEEGARPFVGKQGQAERVNETRVELIFPSHREGPILAALRQAHPYEEIADYVTKLSNANQDVGSGMVGDLESPVEPLEFLKRLKGQMQTPVIRHTAPLHRPVKRVAVCGGAGSFLTSQAIHSGADVFVSADFKYHEFFDAEGKIMLADIGHYESEQFTKQLVVEVLSKKFSTFASNFSKTVTNPISYL